MSQIFRFAPSPNGFLHTGHAYSALLNATLAREAGGEMLLRLEDIDTARCTRAFADAALEDLRWLDLRWSEPVRRQSEHLADYFTAQETLRRRGLLYPCFCTRGDISRATASRADWPKDPDGAPLYPGACRSLPDAVRYDRRNEPHALRLDMAAAMAVTGALIWAEWSDGGFVTTQAAPDAWGDVIVARKDIGTSYHIAVVIDDALQGVTNVVRGRDLFAATSVHRVLQALLGLSAPKYRHHALMRDDFGQKLAKSRAATPLRDLRARGVTAEDVRRSLGF